MRKLTFSILILCMAVIGLRAESSLPEHIILTPYVEHDANTPTADKILLQKLNTIISKYGVGSNTGIQTPFIITGHAIELNKETTATVPPHTAVDISLTLYIGNGEEGVLFSTCNMNLRGVGDSEDKAYAAAFKRIDINDPNIDKAIREAQTRIAKYYEVQGPALLNKAKQLAASGDYSQAYAVLLRIPAVCPQYDQAQQLVLELVHQEGNAYNREVLNRARAAWSADPTENGAAAARDILGEISNPSPEINAEVEKLTGEIASSLQGIAEAERAAETQRQADAHAEQMASIESARRVAVAQAKNQPKYVYHVHWW